MAIHSTKQSPVGPDAPTAGFGPSAFTPAHGERSYFIVFAKVASWVLPLPDVGELIIGRAEDAQLRLEDASVSRRHARVDIDGTDVWLSDLGSHNGTRLNGMRVEGRAWLSSGDEVGVGTLTLVFHRGARPYARRPLYAPQLRRRIDEELERARRYGRTLGFVVLDLGSAAALGSATILRAIEGCLRTMDVVALHGTAEVQLLLPELSAVEVGRVVEGCLAALADLAPGPRAGVAVFPDDAGDADALLARARATRTAEGAGAQGPTRPSVTELQFGEHQMIAADPAILRAFELLARLAGSDLPVLVRGETGAGKELAAAALHAGSPRRAMRLVAVSCASLPDTLVESELFGFEKGAFSGALTAKPGRFESANGSTLFLDEIGELPLPAQAKLLRALETRRVSRLGSVEELEIDVRFVAATNRDLAQEVETGRFRRDLFYRLAAATVIIPPLRDRPLDVPVLAERFLARACAKLGREVPTLSSAVMLRLHAHDWPGNVRELKNVMEFLAATVAGDTALPEHLPPGVAGHRGPLAPAGGGDQPAPPKLSDELRDLERRRILDALDAAGGVQTRAAELIGMPIRTLQHKLKQYGIRATPPRKG
jgi:DNA-binding NtrC family response regulator